VRLLPCGSEVVKKQVGGNMQRIQVTIQYMSPDGLVESETCHPNNDKTQAFFAEYIKEWFSKVKEYEAIQKYEVERPILTFSICEVASHYHRREKYDAEQDTA
jgi:hypothetical protein